MNPLIETLRLCAVTAISVICALLALSAIAAFNPSEPNECEDGWDQDLYVPVLTQGQYRLLRFDKHTALTDHKNPVLIVHGHAGSYRQGRTIASIITTSSHFAADVYMADFKEEWSAMVFQVASALTDPICASHTSFKQISIANGWIEKIFLTYKGLSNSLF